MDLQEIISHLQERKPITDEIQYAIAALSQDDQEKVLNELNIILKNNLNTEMKNK